MKLTCHNRLVLLTVILMVAFIQPVSGVYAQERLRYSCSAQVYEAFSVEMIDEFSRKQGIEVLTHISSSNSALYRLMNDFSDIAGTTQKLLFRHRAYGYVQTPFCRDMLAIIAGDSCSVDTITLEEVREIFGKKLINWKPLGGPDQPIVVVIPGKETGAYHNFYYQVMGKEEIRFDYSSSRSTLAIKAVKNIPNAISFIGFGSAYGKKGIKVIRIDGMSPENSRYPFYQTFSYVTKGNPSGLSRRLINFTFSREGFEIINRKGMHPIQE